MSFFINNPALRQVRTRRGVVYFRLQEPLQVSLPAGGCQGGLWLEVPAGFETDFASVPRWLWWLMPPLGRYSRAALVHDYLYQHHDAMSRFLADALFRELMFHLGVPAWKRLAMYWGVRLFGWLYWRDGKPVPGKTEACRCAAGRVQR